MYNAHLVQKDRMENNRRTVFLYSKTQILKKFSIITIENTFVSSFALH